jgi:hypothetical protein
MLNITAGKLIPRTMDEQTRNLDSWEYTVITHSKATISASSRDSSPRLGMVSAGVSETRGLNLKDALLR